MIKYALVRDKLYHTLDCYIDKAKKLQRFI